MLESIEAGVGAGIAMIMSDGEIIALRGKSTSPTRRFVKVNGVERPIVTYEDWAFGPRDHKSGLPHFRVK